MEEKRTIDTSIVLFFSRLVVPIITASFMGIVSWLTTHISSEIDSHSIQLTSVLRMVDRLDNYTTQKEKFDLENLKALQTVITDHENRLRALERSTHGSAGTR